MLLSRQHGDLATKCLSMLQARHHRETQVTLIRLQMRVEHDYTTVVGTPVEYAEE